jgi:hypothetical protein
MKKGDSYVGETSGLCLKIGDKTKDGVNMEIERRIIDRKTGEVKIEVRERFVPNALVATVLLGYAPN